MPRTKASNAKTTTSKSNRGKKSIATKSSSAKTTQVNADNMKYEIAKEFGVKLGASATAKENGRVGGEMTKRLVAKAKKSK